MKKILPFLIILFTTLLFFILNSKEKKEFSYYHWENNYTLKDNKEKLYIKVLDIAFSNKLEVIKTTFDEKPNNNYIPVVYITNETMKNIDYKNISELILKNIKTLNSFDELQIDCDWSLSTRSNYFNLLKELKSKLNKPLSVTIRLHQIKYYEKTGIPNVDYGVLMYYNMSNLADFEVKNSILDNAIAKQYHFNFDTYKLKLKLALPLYSQAIQFRDKKALDIFEGVKKEDFATYFKQLDENRYEVIKSTYFQGRYIYKGDIFRFEDSTFKDLKIALNDFKKLTKNRFDEIIFYTIKYKNKYNLNEL